MKAILVFLPLLLVVGSASAQHLRARLSMPSDELVELGTTAKAQWPEWLDKVTGNIDNAGNTNGETPQPVCKLWLDKVGNYPFEKKDKSRKAYFGTFKEVPNKFLLHTLEMLWPKPGDYEAGEVALDRGNGKQAHFIVARDRSNQVRIMQTLPLNRMSRCLKKWNSGGAIQVEIGAKAASPFTEHDEEITRAVAALWRALSEATGGTIPVALDARVKWVPLLKIYPGHTWKTTAASARAPQRIKIATFKAVAGLVGHQHAPENDHWDPGHIQPEKLVQLAGQPSIKVGCVWKAKTGSTTPTTPTKPTQPTPGSSACECRSETKGAYRGHCADWDKSGYAWCYVQGTDTCPDGKVGVWGLRYRKCQPKNIVVPQPGASKDPCGCRTEAKGSYRGHCADWDGSGHNWCYVNDSQKCSRGRLGIFGIRYRPC